MDATASLRVSSREVWNVLKENFKKVKNASCLKTRLFIYIYNQENNMYTPATLTKVERESYSLVTNRGLSGPTVFPRFFVAFGLGKVVITRFFFKKKAVI